jgi:trypsin
MRAGACRLIALAAVGAAALVPAAAGAAERQPMIVGGGVDETPDVGWIAALKVRGSYTCTGSLVAPAFVLTAAHCTLRTRARHWVVRLDTKDRDEGGVVRRVRRILRFPRFRTFDDFGDMALLRLRRPVDVEPVRLVRTGTHWIGNPGYIAGWGQTRGGIRPSARLLRSVWVPIRPDPVCVRQYGLWESRAMLCAGNRRRGTCAGDSGGPLARHVDGAWRLAGVTSFGTQRCNRPGGYTWVGGKPLRRWLREHLGA